ncbi:MAG TPA: zinc-ribbon domain-containing protein [Pyrinomonadaceae bacterium]|jgi:CheY-like chemotaxis protein|nr:zinc-ribbon domain-containing protein [Pyrinomonadaceae bacterium]
MIIICQKCDSRLQLDEARVPARPFVIRCPKCHSSVDSGFPNPAAEQNSAVAAGSPATENSRFEQPNPAPLFEPPKVAPVVTSNAATDKLAELLSGLINQPAVASRKLPYARPSWDPRKALVCVAEEHRELVASSMNANGYQVFVANDARQAVDRMRENLLDVVLLDPRFDPVEQGPVFVTREVNVLRPAQRRRLFFVLLSPSLRSMDAHTAFLNNVNAIINVSEIDQLPSLIERRVHEYNELYRDFNLTLGIQAL